MKWFLRVTRMKARSPAGRPAQLLLRCGRDGKGGLIAASPNYATIGGSDLIP